MSWLIKNWTPFTTALAADLNQFRDNLELLKLHTHTGAAGDGAVIYGGLDYVQIAPMPALDGNWRTVVTAACAFGGYLQTAAGSSDSTLTLPMPPLRNGTWRIDVLHPEGPDMGIITVAYNGTSWGTIDCYAAGASVDNTDSLTGKTIADFAPGVGTTLTLTVNTKNASASAYYGRVQFLALRRTGA